MLTKKQKNLLDYIEKFIGENDYSPSIPEIGKKFKLANSTIHEHIENLKEKGYLNKTDHRARAIEVLEKEQKFELVEISLIGTIAAGLPIKAVGEYETIAIPKSLLTKSGEHFALRVQGNSMIQDGIFDGDNVIIRKQSTAENGETIVAIINGNEATLKKIYKIPGGFKLQPANPTIPPLLVKELIVQGKVISVIRSYEARRSINKTLNLFIFNNELKEIIVKAQEEVRTKFKPNKEFNIWQKTETEVNQDKFFLETTYTFLNELILLWISKDKNLVHFETIQTGQELLLLKKEAEKVYEHIFSSNIFDWFAPSNLLLQNITNIFNKYDFSQIDRDIIGKLYEQFISREERKRLGQFYTPEPIIDYILDQTGYINNIEDKKIIDTACGSGGFITRAANRLIDKLKNYKDKKFIIGKVINNVYGLEINPFACYLAETNILIQLLDLTVQAKHENPGYKVPRIKIFQTNTIQSISLLDTDHQEEIENIKNKTGHLASGFDFVVGNPPYLEAKKMDKKTKKFCMETCPEVARGAFDLFVCFIDKGLKLLGEGGKFGYIIPNKFLIANYAKNMRAEILNNFSIKEIIDVSECEIFENVSVYPIILIIDKKKPINNTIKTAEKIINTQELLDKNFVVSEISQDIYKRDDLVFFTLPNGKKQNSLLVKLLRGPYQRLDNYLSIKWTISFHASGLRDKFLFPEKPLSEFAKKLIGGKSFAGNNDINRYKLTWGEWWINYDEELAKKSRNQLPPKTLFEGEKLIICQNALRLRATYDNENFFCKDTFFTAKLKNNLTEDFNLKFFLALLNSKLLHYYYANIYKGTHIAGGYLHYLIGYLSSLPIAKPTQKQQLDIVTLVEKILKTADVKKFNEIDQQIDGLIYKLYSLNKNEVSIIESFI